MKTFETLKIEDIELRERSDQTDKHGNPVTFPVVLIAGVSLNISANSQSISKRTVSLPLNGFSMQEAQRMFKPGDTIEGYKVEQYEVEPYEWETPEGEIRVDNVRYRLVPADQKSESSTPRPTDRKSIESQVFNDKAPRTNDLQQQA